MSDRNFVLMAAWLMLAAFVCEGVYMLVAPGKYPSRPRWFMRRWFTARGLQRMDEARRNRTIRLFGLLWLVSAALLGTALARDVVGR